MIQLCPEVEHWGNESEVTECIIKRVYHKLMLVLIQHGFEQVLHTHALPVNLRVLLTVRGLGRGVDFPGEGTFTAVKGRVLFVRWGRLCLWGSGLERGWLLVVFQPVDSQWEAEIRGLFQETVHYVGEVPYPGLLEVPAPENYVPFLYFLF